MQKLISTLNQFPVTLRSLRVKTLGIFVALLFVAVFADAQTIYTFNSKGTTTASWQNPKNWSNNNLPVSGAVIEIAHPENANTLNITDVPAGMIIAQIRFADKNAFVVNMEAATANGVVYLGTANGPENVLELPSYGSLIFSGKNNSRFVINAGHKAIIEGTILFEGQTNAALEAATAAGIIFKSGSIATLGNENTAFEGFAFGNGSVTGSVVFEAGSKLVQFAGNDPLGNNNVVNMMSGSIFEYASRNEAHNLVLEGHSFGDFVYSSPLAKSVVTNKAFNLNNLTVANGSLSIEAQGNQAATIKGNVLLNAPFQLSGKGGRFNVSLSQNAAISGEAALLVNTGATLLIEAGTTVDLFTNIEVSEITPLSTHSFGAVEVANTARLNIHNENFISGNGRFTLKPGATLGIGSKDGISLEVWPLTIPRRAEMTKGNVRAGGLTTRVFASEAHYIYMGSQNQESGTGLPVNNNWRGTTLPAPSFTLAAASDNIELTLTRTVRTSIFTLQKGILNTTSGNLKNAVRIMGNNVNGVQPGLLVAPANGGTLKAENTVFEFQGPVEVKADATLDLHDVHLANLAPWAVQGGAISDFGSTGKPVINGTLYIHEGARVQHNGPAYGKTGGIMYQSMTEYYRGAEWAPAAERGTPNNVAVRSKTILIASGENGALKNIPLVMNGNLLLYKSSDFTMEANGADMSSALEIKGKMNIEGSFTGSVKVAGDILIGEFGSLNLRNAGGNLLEATNIQIEGGLNASHLAPSQITINGNWSRNALNGRFVAGSSKVVFQGAGSQLELTNNASKEAEYFYDLEIKKNNSSVALLTGADVSHQLILTSGRIESNKQQPVRILNPKADDANNGVVVANNKSFVEGVLIRTTEATKGTYLFPVGKMVNGQTDVKAFRLQDVNAKDLFTGEYFPTAVPAGNNGYGSFASNLSGIVHNSHWEIVPVNAGTSAQITLPYSKPAEVDGWLNAAGKNVVPNAANSYVAIVAATGNKIDWNLPANGNLLPFAQSGDITGIAVTAFGTFSLGVKGGLIAGLELKQFNALLQNNDGILTWNLADAQNLKEFELEYSSNGVAFEKLSKINGSTATQYSFRHKDLLTGTYNYRLTMVSALGIRTQSDVVILKIDANRTVIAGLLTNPVQGGQAILQVFSAKPQAAEVVIVDNSGRMVQSHKVNLQTGANNTRIPVATLAGGMYRMVVKTNDGIQKAVPVSIF